jgi:transposase
MANSYSMDLRSRVVADVDAGLKPVEVAQKYRVSRSWVYKIIRFRHETGSYAARQPRRCRSNKLDAAWPQLEQAVLQRPDATLRELREQLNLPVGLSTIWRALKRMHFTFKKSLACQ